MLQVRGQQVLLDCDVAALYGVETRIIKSGGQEQLALHTEPDAQKRKSMMRHFGKALTDIVMPDLTTAETESSMEINFLIGKLKHTVRWVRKVE